ncbi:MAG: cytochrome b N-terminal domain-containing protein [Nitrospinae bacterium]|nr:cytochrome b N-terminal domain-containing protein [Nitrospinota bacterium]
MTKNDAPKRDKSEYGTSIKDILNWFTLGGLVYGPLDERLGIKEALEKALKRPIPYHVNWSFCFGGITFFIFCIQVLTGGLLLFFYRPTTDEAYYSVQFITNDVPFGWLIRGVHYWSSHLMIITLSLHMLRVFLYGVYKSPREFNWVVGILLFLITLWLGFTGALMAWNNTLYWRGVIGTSKFAGIPIVGDFIVKFLRGGEYVGGASLTRFFAFHIFIFPSLLSLLLILHFLMIRRQGISGPL